MNVLSSKRFYFTPGHMRVWCGGRLTENTFRDNLTQPVKNMSGHISPKSKERKHVMRITIDRESLCAFITQKKNWMPQRWSGFKIRKLWETKLKKWNTTKNLSRITKYQLRRDKLFLFCSSYIKFPQTVNSSFLLIPHECHAKSRRRQENNCVWKLKVSFS